MFQKVSLKEFNVPTENIAVLDGTVFIDSYKRNNKHSYYSVMAVDAIRRGRLTGIITDLELGKFKRIVGLDTANELFYGKIGKNSECLCYEIMIADYLDEYEIIPAYYKLFKLCKSTNLHLPDLTSIITSIETDKPLITNDFHHWQQQSNIIKAYRERHSEKIVKERIERKRPSDMRMYDSKDFCDIVLHL